MNEALHRLAAAAGIEPGYWDGLGTRRELQDDTAEAILASLGIDTAVGAAAQALEDAPFAAPLAPAVALEAGAASSVEIALPVSQRGESFDWELWLESGEKLTGNFVPARLDCTAERVLGPSLHGKFRLPLPRPLPPGYHRFVLPGLGCTTTLICAPARCHIRDEFTAGARCWGIAVQLYSLRSPNNWGMGDFGDLSVLAHAAGCAGADCIGLNPLHARHLARPGEASPYAPSSRLFLDPLYIDVGAVPDLRDSADARAAVNDATFQQRLAAARATVLVDHAAVSALKLPVLQMLHRSFRKRLGDAGDARARAFREFARTGGAALEHFSEFEALRLHFLETDNELPRWQDWAAELKTPDGEDVAVFRVSAAEGIEFQMYLQWQAALQLEAAAAAARSAGMRIGLYRDLAVGAAADSAETWGAPGLFALDMSVGAPPDMLNRQGQDWGMPPWIPRALAQRGFAPYAELLAANMRAAGALRIDHVMALTRLFWIPAGMRGTQGGYVQSDFALLAAVLTLESTRSGCMVIGEDLGSVPDGLRERLHALGLLSYRVLIFERHWSGDGSFRRPSEYPPQALATVATHDMPPIAEYWQGGDIDRREALGLFESAQQAEEERGRRAAERTRLLQLIAETGLPAPDPPDTAQIAEALHCVIARSHSMLALVQLDDLTGETTPVNIPGTCREYPNWRRKLSLEIDELLGDPRWERICAIMREAGRARGSAPE